MLETLDHTIRISSTPTFLYFDLYLYSAYAAHYVYGGIGLVSGLLNNDILMAACHVLSQTVKNIEGSRKLNARGHHDEKKPPKKRKNGKH